MAAVALLAGCGGDAPDTAVEAYVEQANAVQERAKPRFDALNANFATFSDGKLTGRKAELALRQGEIDLGATRDELSRLRPPPSATELHRRLLRTYDLSVSLASESRQMAGYVPQATLILSGLERIRLDLRTRLRGSRVPDRQAAALQRYAALLSGVTGRLKALEPPPVLLATHRGQLDRLRQTRSLAERLVRAIERRDAETVARLLGQFRDAGGPDPVTDALARGSIRAYEQRATQVQRAAADAQRERTRLVRLATPDE